MTLQLEGFDEVINKLNELGNNKKIEAALGEACGIVEKAAKEKAPKATGALRRSIESKVENNQGIIFTALDYAPYVEYGTGLFAIEGGRETAWRYKDDKGNWHTTNGQQPQPFLTPALNENREEITRKFKEAITE